MNDFGDFVVTHTEVQLGWLDRLRVLVRGALVVRVKTLTQHPVGRTESTSRVELPRLLPHWLRRRPAAVETGMNADESGPC